MNILTWHNFLHELGIYHPINEILGTTNRLFFNIFQCSCCEHFYFRTLGGQNLEEVWTNFKTQGEEANPRGQWDAWHGKLLAQRVFRSWNLWFSLKILARVSFQPLAFPSFPTNIDHVFRWTGRQPSFALLIPTGTILLVLRTAPKRWCSACSHWRFRAYWLVWQRWDTLWHLAVHWCPVEFEGTLW